MVPPGAWRNRSKKCINLIWLKRIKTHYLALKPLFQLRHWSTLLIPECVNHRLHTLIIRSSTAEYPWRTVQVTGAAEKKKSSPFLPTTHHWLNILSVVIIRMEKFEGNCGCSQCFPAALFPYTFCIFSAAAVWDRINSGFNKLQLNNRRAFLKIVDRMDPDILFLFLFFLQTLYWVFCSCGKPHPCLHRVW